MGGWVKGKSGRRGPVGNVCLTGIAAHATAMAAAQHGGG